MKTVTSSQITFIDTTDSRKLEVYIASNLPTVQIYNVNTAEYSPDWSATNLSLTADIFLDSEEITSNDGLTIRWYQKNGTNAKTQIFMGNNLTVYTNEMSGSNSIITYICEVEYQGLLAQDQITFSRNDTGLNGTNGADGTSVTIIGTAYYNGVLTQDVTGQIVTLYADSEFTTPLDTSQLDAGDSYVVQGYLCVYSPSDNAFICTGTIQGPEGKPGVSAKNIILNGDAQAFKVSKDNVISPATISVTAQEINTTVTNWTYSVNGGQTFLSTAPNGVIRNGSTVTITGANIASNMLIIKASDGTYSDTYTIYKVFDGADGNSGASAPIAFLTNENITFSADAQGQVLGTTVTSNVAAYDGAIKVTPTLGAISDLPEGITINTEDIITVNNELVLSIVVANNAMLGSTSSVSGTISIPVISPVNTVLSLSWSKINTGATGDHGTDAITFQVYSSNGYILSKDTPSITLNTFAYSGDAAITSGATYQWYKLIEDEAISTAGIAYYNGRLSDKIAGQVVELFSDEEFTTTLTTSDNNGDIYIVQNYLCMYDQTLNAFVYTGNIYSVNGGYWDIIDNETNASYNVVHSDVSTSASYMCQMIFDGNEYVDVVTIDDKNDTNTVFTSKPESYMVGDIWIVGDDYMPTIMNTDGTPMTDTDGNAMTYDVGTVLKAQYSNTTYSDGDWILATKYDDRLDNLETDVGTYKQYISLDSQTGIKMTAIDENGNASKFSTTLSNTQLSFNEDGEAVAYINNHKMHITEAEVVSPLTVTGEYSGSTMIQAPTINLGGFSLIVESNGSLSIVSNI